MCNYCVFSRCNRYSFASVLFTTLSNKFLLSLFCARISTNYNRVCLQFDAYTSLHGLYRMLTEPPVKMMVVGASKSECSQGTSQLAELWNLVQVSYLVILQVSICQSVSLSVCVSVILSVCISHTSQTFTQSPSRSAGMLHGSR